MASIISQSVASFFSDIHSHKLTTTAPLAVATIATGLAASLAAWCYRDYQEYLALGPGGPPYNVLGWAAITLVARPFAMSKADALLVSDYPQDGAHESIRQLPSRQGERAVLGGIAPHRQLSQHAPEAMRQFTTNLFLNAAKQHPELVEIKRSLYERHHEALFVSKSLLSTSNHSIPDTARICRGEIGHVHPDLSVHIYLHPADARQVIEKCWAERHRLSAPKTWLLKSRFAIADTYLMVYGPRDEEEMEVLRVILESSVKFMTGAKKVQKIEWRTAL